MIQEADFQNPLSLRFGGYIKLSWVYSIFILIHLAFFIFRKHEGRRAL